jgi:hypothetical protein
VTAAVHCVAKNGVAKNCVAKNGVAPRAPRFLTRRFFARGVFARRDLSRWWHARHRDDTAMVGAEALFGGVLVTVIGTLITIGLWSMLDARLAAAEAARAGTRTFVQSEQLDRAAAAHQASVEVLAAHRRNDASQVQVRHGTGRCAMVEVTVLITVDWLPLRFLGGAPTTTIRATDTEVIDAYRSDARAQGVADCG